MEDRGGEHGRSPADTHSVDKMRERACAAGGDDRHGHGGRQCTRQRKIIAFSHAVRIHRGQQDLASAEFGRTPRIIDSIDAGRPRSAMRENLPPIRTYAFGVDGGDDALRAEAVGGFRDEFRPRDGLGVHRHLVGPGEQKRTEILDRPHAAADRQRHETLIRGAADDVEERAPPLFRRADVEKAEFVGAGRIIGARRLDGIAGVYKIDKVDALDDPAALDVETGDHTDFLHTERSEIHSAACPRASCDQSVWIYLRSSRRQPGSRVASDAVAKTGSRLSPGRAGRKDRSTLIALHSRL